MKKILLAFVLMNISSNLFSQDVPISEKNALLEFYQQTSSCSSWSNHTNWNTSQPVKNWYGITTTSELGISGPEQVVSIILGFNGLCGTIPYSIENLPKLRDLRIHGNDLYGELPQTISNLSDLKTVILYGNNFSGNIGDLFANSINLTSLNIRDNQFTGYVNLKNNINLTSFIETDALDWSTSTPSTNQIDAVLFDNGKNNIITEFIIRGVKCMTVDNPTNATNNVAPYNFGGAYKIKWFNNVKNFSTNCSSFLATIDLVSNKRLLIHPNPVQNILIINTNDKTVKGEIFSISGQKIKTFSNNKIDVTDLPKGIYILKANTNNKIISQKFIKE